MVVKKVGVRKKKKKFNYPLFRSEMFSTLCFHILGIIIRIVISFNLFFAQYIRK